MYETYTSLEVLVLSIYIILNTKPNVCYVDFAAYKAGRHDAYGTWFIRILVATFYKHSCHRDVDELFKIVSYCEVFLTYG